MSALDDVEPSIVNGTLCLPTVSHETFASFPLQVEVGEPDVEGIAFLRVEVDFTVQRETPKQRHSGTEPHAPDVPLGMAALVGVERRVIQLKPSAEEHALHHRISVVLVPLGESPYLVVDRRLAPASGRGLGPSHSGDGHSPAVGGLC